MDIKITKKDKEFTFESLGITVKDFIVSSMSLRTNYDEADGRHGKIDGETLFVARQIIVPFHFEAVDLMDFPLLRDYLFGSVQDTNPFYIQELRRPKVLSYKFVDTNEPALMDEESANKGLSGKRYLVRLQNSFEIEQMMRYGEGELVFETVELPFAESTGTTLDPLTFDAEKWQVGQGLTLEEPKYVHSTRTFKIFNAGDVALDPRQFPIKIIYRGASNYLNLKNQTNGDEWAYQGTSGANDTITLDGVRSLKNNVSIFGKTNKRLLSLEPGWNDIQLTGTSGSFLISFEHRFYYL